MHAAEMTKHLETVKRGLIAIGLDGGIVRVSIRWDGTHVLLDWVTFQTVFMGQPVTEERDAGHVRQEIDAHGVSWAAVKRVERTVQEVTCG